jgi:flagellar M-ring protein FliF
VHLAFPETALFRKTQGRAKASVTVTMKSGMSLSRGQVQGIQRLVAASVPDVEVADVTVVDQKGIALTGTAGDGPGEVLSARLEAKKQTEDYFARKVAEVLEKAFGPGQGIASVDVLLNFDQVKVTAEEVLPAKGRNSEQGSAGVIVRERQSVREPGEGSAADAGTSLSQTEVDYQNGRRVEQIVTTPGSLRRISVGVVVPNAVDSQQLERIRDVVSMAVGLNKERGDTISVYSVDQLSSAPPLHSEVIAEQAPATASESAPTVVEQSKGRFTQAALAVLGLLFAMVAILLFRRQRVPAQAEPVPVPLVEGDRQVLLNNVRQWIESGARPQLLEK